MKNNTSKNELIGQIQFMVCPQSAKLDVHSKKYNLKSAFPKKIATIISFRELISSLFEFNTNPKPQKFSPRLLLFILSFILSFSMLSYAQAPHNTKIKQAIILVPGYFNTIIPGFFNIASQNYYQTSNHFNVEQAPTYGPYWSQTIIQSLEKKGFDLYIVDNLNPIGTIEENAWRLKLYFDRINSEISRSTSQLNIKPWIFAHSAGGLYSLYAAAKYKIAFSKLITLGTPFNGLKIVERIHEIPILGKNLTQLLPASFYQLSPTKIHALLDQIQYQLPKIEIINFAGIQTQPYNVWDHFNSTYLSPPLRIISELIDEASDGIVEKSSALARNLVLYDETGAVINFHRQFTLPIPLEHWEQVLDYRFFTIMGIWNLNSIRQGQEQFIQIF